MIDMSFNMREELKHGEKGELDIVRAYPRILVHRPDIEEYDIDSIPNGLTIEVKTEYRWSLKNTPNFFMEKFSDDINYKPGGPWRALNDNIDLYIQYFIQDGVLFIFKNIKGLVEELGRQGFGRKLVPVEQDHGRYNTLGYPVSRKSLEHLYTEVSIGEREDLLV